jgi:anti-anti-sigma factor
MEIKVTNKSILTIISLIGPIDYNTPELLEKDIKTLLRGKNPDFFVINARDLDFVGSSGIEQFLIIIKKLFGEEAKYIGLKKEFQRCFRAFSGNKTPFKLYSSAEEILKERNPELPNITQTHKQVHHLLKNQEVL